MLDHPAILEDQRRLFLTDPEALRGAVRRFTNATQAKAQEVQLQYVAASLTPKGTHLWREVRAFSLFDVLRLGAPGAPIVLCALAAEALRPSDPDAAALEVPGRVLLRAGGGIFDLSRTDTDDRARPLSHAEIGTLYIQKTGAEWNGLPIQPLTVSRFIARLRAGVEYGARRRGDSGILARLTSCSPLL